MYSCQYTPVDYPEKQAIFSGQFPRMQLLYFSPDTYQCISSMTCCLGYYIYIIYPLKIYEPIRKDVSRLCGDVILN